MTKKLTAWLKRHPPEFYVMHGMLCGALVAAAGLLIIVTV